MARKTAGIQALRKSTKAHEKNRLVKTTVSKLLKTGGRLIATKKFSEAKDFMPKLAQAIDKAAHRQVLKKNTASRMKSRFAKQLQRAMKP